MASNVLDTAKYILEQAGSMSPMKLQKLCYYAQAWSLVWDDSPLFVEDFQAWETGPVCPELFYKTQGKCSVSASDEIGGVGDLSDNQKDTIDKVLEYYGGYDSQWLSQLTIMEGSWIKTREDVPSGNVIAKERMKIYYKNLILPEKQKNN